MGTETTAAAPTAAEMLESDFATLPDLIRAHARERGLEDDDFLNLSGLPEQVYREAYRRIAANYVPGPYGTAELVRDKRLYAYPDRPIPKEEVDSVLEEDARLCPGSLYQ